MKNDDNFNANGQVVFVDPMWVTGDSCLFNFEKSHHYSEIKSKLSKMRKDFLIRLEQEGFVITYNSLDINDDVVCLIMDSLAICDINMPIHIYKKEFDKRMFAAGGDKLHYPYSVTVEEYFNNPFFPAVFKNEMENGGIDKFLIETPEQLEIIKKLYMDYSLDKRYTQAFDYCIFQQLIETPTNFQTYMRVLMSASGEVMGASLKYSRVGNQRRKPVGMFEQYFWDEKSKYFLNCNGMFNYYSDSGNISFSQPRYSYEKQSILEAHGIDPNKPMIPSEVLEVAASIVQKCNRELGIMCGFDFIFNKSDNKWYYLENQAFPAIEEWATTKDINIVKANSVQDCIKYFALDLEARYDALMMYMKKKLSYENSSEENTSGAYSLKLK